MTTQAVASAGPAVRETTGTRLLAAAFHVFAFACAAACLYSMRRADPDLYGYLASGRLFVEQGLTAHDPFAYTSAGLTWVTFEYGAHIVLWLAYSLAGPAGLIAVKCLLGGIALSLMAVAARGAARDPRVWVPVFLLCGSAVSRFFLFRPQLFTFAFFALFVAVLFRYLAERRARLWVLPIVMLVWTNTHGGFVAGLGAIGLAMAIRVALNIWPETSESRPALEGTMPLSAAFAACFAVTFVNPMGPRLWTYVMTELLHGTNRRYTVEWGPASLRTDAWSAVALALVVAMFAVVTWFACRGQSKPVLVSRLVWALSCVPLLAMAWLSVRHVPLAAIWTAPVIARLASRAFDSEAFPRAWVAVGGIASLPACLTVAFVFTQPQPVISADGGALGSRNPCRAVAFLEANRLSGHVFTPLWWGSYVTWRLYPSIRVSMDGRNISLFPDRMVIENFDFYLRDAGTADLDAPLKYATDFLLVPSDSPVLSRVDTDRRWHAAYRDDDAALFMRSDAARPAAFLPPPPSCSRWFQ